jgi:SAM-dependent methyltransferase
MREHTKKNPVKEPYIYDKEMYDLSYSRKSWNSSRKLLARCIRKGKPGPMLDIGCGLGLFVECCYRFGIPCSGLEGSKYAVNAAIERESNLDIRQHFLEDSFPFEDETFSMVMCNQVIEHLTKETAQNALRESYRVLTEGGNIIVYSPSMYNLKQAADPTHINLHTPGSLKKELEKAGFTQVKSFNKSIKIEWGPFSFINKAARALFTLLPLPFFSATANCIATKTREEY